MYRVYRRRRALDLRTFSQLIHLKMTPEFTDRHLAWAIVLPINQRAEVLHFTLCIADGGELGEVPDDLFALDTIAVVVELSPPVHPDVWSFGARNTIDRPLLIARGSVSRWGSSRHGVSRLLEGLARGVYLGSGPGYKIRAAEPPVLA